MHVILIILIILSDIHVYQLGMYVTLRMYLDRDLFSAKGTETPMTLAVKPFNRPLGYDAQLFSYNDEDDV
jgi:hypothetical protein